MNGNINKWPIVQKNIMRDDHYLIFFKFRKRKCMMILHK